jgi:hypothetical protein
VTVIKLLSEASMPRIRPRQIFVSSSDEIRRRRKAAAAWVSVQNSGGPAGFVAASSREDAAVISALAPTLAPASSVRREIRCRVAAKNDDNRVREPRSITRRLQAIMAERSWLNDHGRTMAERIA